MLYKSVTCPDFDMYPQMLKRKDKTINQNCEENWFDSNLITFSRWCLQGWVASRGGSPPGVGRLQGWVASKGGSPPRVGRLQGWCPQGAFRGLNWPPGNSIGLLVTQLASRGLNWLTGASISLHGASIGRQGPQLVSRGLNRPLRDIIDQLRPLETN